MRKAGMEHEAVGEKSTKTENMSRGFSFLNGFIWFDVNLDPMYVLSAVVRSCQ